MPPVAYNKWMAYFDRLEQEYKNRCTTCQKILADVSEITIGAKERKTEEGKAKEKKKASLMQDLKKHRTSECKQVRIVNDINPVTV